jgi:hypothetical protein
MGSGNLHVRITKVYRGGHIPCETQVYLLGVEGLEQLIALGDVMIPLRFPDTR